MRDPGGGGFDDVLTAAFGAFGVIAGVLLAVPIVVAVEASVEAEACVEDERADKRPGPVAGLLQYSRERR